MYYGYEETSALSGAPLAIIGVVGGIFAIIQIIAQWKIFSKAGEKGWKSIIPIYNIVILLKISGMKAWQFILLLIPGVNIVIEFLIFINLAKKFGKGTGFGVLMVFFPIICQPILAFGKATYGGAVTEQKDVSILDVAENGVPSSTEKTEFSYGYEKEPTVVMDPVNPNSEGIVQNQAVEVANTESTVTPTPEIDTTNVETPGALNAEIPSTVESIPQDNATTDNQLAPEPVNNAEVNQNIGAVTENSKETQVSDLQPTPQINTESLPVNNVEINQNAGIVPENSEENLTQIPQEPIQNINEETPVVNSQPKIDTGNITNVQADNSNNDFNSAN